MRRCLRILAPRYGEDFPDVINFVESQIRRGEWFPVLRPWEAALLFYPECPERERAFLEQMQEAITKGELVAYGDLKDRLIRGSFSAWVNCPPVPKSSPLSHWLPTWMRADDDAESDQPGPDVPQESEPQRRLRILRKLGGSATYRMGEWRFTGVSRLVEHEKGKPRSSEKTIRDDLREASEAESRARRAGQAAPSPWGASR